MNLLYRADKDFGPVLTKASIKRKLSLGVRN